MPYRLYAIQKIRDADEPECRILERRGKTTCFGKFPLNRPSDIDVRFPAPRHTSGGFRRASQKYAVCDNHSERPNPQEIPGIPPTEVRHDPGKRDPHRGKAQPVTRRKYPQGQASPVGGKPALNHGDDGCPHACGADARQREKKTCRPERVDRAHEHDADGKDEETPGNHPTRTQSVCEVTGQRGKRDI